MNKLVNNVLISYEEIGTGIPVVCLHGYRVDSDLMNGCLEPVFQNHNNYRRIYVDLVGMGNTPANNLIKNSDDFLQLLADFISQLLGSDPFILMGESFGGYLCLGLIKRFKHQIAGMFLICPCTVGNRKSRKLPPKQVIVEEELEISDDKKSDFQIFLNMAVIISEYTWNRYQREILIGIKKTDFSYIRSLDIEGYPLSDEKDFSRIKYNNPITFLLGKQDHVVGYEDPFRLQGNFPRGTYAVLDSAGHNLQIEKPELFSAFLEDFLRLV